MKTASEGEHDKDFWWVPGLQRLLHGRKPEKALWMLDQVIFNGETFEQKSLSFFGREDREYAVLCKANLLSSLRRTHEALAWLCLENALHPDNASAAAMKAELLGKLRESGVEDKPDKADQKFSLGWEGVAGMEEVKLRFDRDVILPLKRPDIYAEYKLSPPNGVLLWGPPGCGKTFLASKLAERLEFSFIEIKASALASIYVHGTVEKIAAAFDEAEESAPAIVFIDEIDAIAPARTGLYHSYAEEVNQLLVRLNNCSEKGITVIAATNTPERIDPAIKRPGRFDIMIYVPPPDMAAREQLFSIYLDGRKRAADIQISSLAMNSGDYTCVDIKHICDEAARAALMLNEPITQEHLLRALAENPPSVSSAELKEYEKKRNGERG